MLVASTTELARFRPGRFELLDVSGQFPSASAYVTPDGTMWLAGGSKLVAGTLEAGFDAIAFPIDAVEWRSIAGWSSRGMTKIYAVTEENTLFSMTVADGPTHEVLEHWHVLGGPGQATGPVIAIGADAALTAPIGYIAETFRPRLLVYRDGQASAPISRPPERMAGSCSSPIIHASARW